MPIQKKRILLVSSVTNTIGAASHLHHVWSFKRYSKHEFHFHNFIYDIDPKFDFSPFDVVVLAHNFWPALMSEAQRAAFKACSALKVQFLQDEYQYVRDINRYLEEMGINVMFTCVAERDFSAFYPKEIMASLEAVYPALTGYVPESLEDPRLRMNTRRPIDIGYRSRVSPYYLGLIGREKLVIAERFRALADEHGFTHNISIRENDRIYGPAWIKFLQSSRFQLGTPSGASIVDMDGSIIEAETEFRRAHAHATFEEVWGEILEPHEGKLKIDTISPRIFEYAATGTTMVMHEGEYGGYIDPERHYIAVNKDYSNISDVIAKMRDPAFSATLAENAFQDLIASGRFSYRSFIESFDAIIERHTANRPVRSTETLSETAFNNMMAETHQQALFFNEHGWYLADTETGKSLKATEEREKQLLRVPFLGSYLRRVGGQPIHKVAKGRAAIRLTRGIPEFRALLMRWLFDGNLRRRVPISDLLRDILFLGSIKAAQTGRMQTSQAFHVRCEIDLDRGALILKGHSVDQAEPAGLSELMDEPFVGALGFFDVLKSKLENGREFEVLWDMTEVFPIQTFAVAITFQWAINGLAVLYRSDPDEYFPFHALKEMSVKHRKEVEFAIWNALTPAYGPDQHVLAHAFD